MARKSSWKKALGITKAKREFERKTGIPTPKSGLKRKQREKLGKLLDAVFHWHLLSVFYFS